MVKKTLVILLAVVMCNIVEAETYRWRIPICDYITQLKSKLSSLRAEEAALKNSLKLNHSRCILLAGSIGLCHVLCSLAEHNNLLTKSQAKWIRYGYPATIVTYYWTKLVMWIFITSDIKVIKEELDALQAKRHL